MVSGGLRRILLLLENEATEVKEGENEMKAKGGGLEYFHLRM